MTKKDVPVVHRLLREYLSQFNLVPVMNQEEVTHWLLPQENIIDTFLVEVFLFIFLQQGQQKHFHLIVLFSKVTYDDLLTGWW